MSRFSAIIITALLSIAASYILVSEIFNSIGQRYMESVSTGSASGALMPEPATAAIILVGGLIMLQKNILSRRRDS